MLDASADSVIMIARMADRIPATARFLFIAKIPLPFIQLKLISHSAVVKPRMLQGDDNVK